MATKTKISFVLPKSLKEEFFESMIRSKYTLREKSKWIAEAIEGLLQISHYPELVSYNDVMRGFDANETIVIDYALKLKLEKAILTIRKEFPTLDGVKSGIVRTAIMQRILRS
tara:strand:- start:73393 stop:73731 length:339 start_codon:yes stop_codon:yes gene_type:complete